MEIQLEIKLISDLGTSTYHTARYDEDTLFIGGSDWERKSVLKETGHMHSAHGVLYHLQDGKVINTYPSDSDMLYIVEVVSPNTLFLGAKTGRNAFQLFSISERKVVRQQSDEKGDGCYGTLYVPEKKELVMNTRNGWLQTVDSETLEIKESVKITPPEIRLWQIHYDEQEDIIYTSDYLGNLYKIQKKGLRVIKKFCLSDMYKHTDNHNNPPSLWGLSSRGKMIVGGDRFGGITMWDKELNLKEHFRLKKSGARIFDPYERIPSSEIESVMSLRMINEDHFLFGSRWGNVFVGNLKGSIRKVLDVPMGIQKENSAFTMERVEFPSGVEILVTFGDGQVYSVQYNA